VEVPPHGPLDGIEKRRAVNRFSKERGCIHPLRRPSGFRIVISREDDDRQSHAARFELRLQLLTRHPWHPNVEHQATECFGVEVVEELLRGGEGAGIVPSRAQQALESTSGRWVIIDHEHTSADGHAAKIIPVTEERYSTLVVYGQEFG
jgi:DNA-binding transcriptional LysR family regulator